MWLNNLRLVLPNGIIERGAMRIEDANIAEIIDGDAPETGLDTRGMTVLPGLIDLHGDMLERDIEPRPRARFPVEMALFELDKRLAGTGITTAYAAGGAWNESFWDNARFNELLLAARSEIDEETRRAMYHEMQELVSFEGSTIIPMYNNYVMAVSNDIGTPEQISSNWNFDGFRCVERWGMA